VPAWDSIAASREYEILHDPSALAKAEAAFAYVEDGKLFALGACPQIRYQQPNGEANHLKTLETDARERLSQLGRRRLAETWPIEVRPFHEQDTIARTRREKSEDAAGRSGAGNRDVVRVHRVQASAGKMVTYNLHAFDVARPFFLVLATFFEPAAGLGVAAATNTAAGGALLNSTS